MDSVTGGNETQKALRGLKLHNLINKAVSLNLSLDVKDFSHLDVERVWTIKTSYDEVIQAKHKKK